MHISSTACFALDLEIGSRLGAIGEGSWCRERVQLEHGPACPRRGTGGQGVRREAHDCVPAPFRPVVQPPSGDGFIGRLVGDLCERSIENGYRAGIR